MAGGPVVLLGQGEQYDDPDDWRELVRARRIRRGVELAVRRDGLTTLQPPEAVPELVPVLDELDPPGPPSHDAPRAQGATPPYGGGAVPMTPAPGAGAVTPGPAAAQAPAPGAAGAPGRPLPTAAPRRGWRFGLGLCVLGGGALLLLRLCGHDGFGPTPAFGDRASASRLAASPAGEPAGCAKPRGWIAQAACDDADFARLRPALSRAYASRAAGLDGAARGALSAEQARWSAGRSACRKAADPAACLAPRYRARIAELQEARPPVAASAAEEPASAPAAASTDAGPGQPLAAVGEAQWARRPSADEVADAFPERAQRLDIGGHARLACRVTGGGALTACDVLSEDPPDYGFGAAALRLSRFYQLRPTAPDGHPVEGARVEVPVAFRGG